MDPDGRRVGAHLPLGQGMVRAVERARAIGLDTLQLFSDNPTAWRRRATPPRELPAFRARVDELGMGPLAIHASYLVNLAGSDPELVDRSVAVLASELRVAPEFGARFVNVHVGSHRGTDRATGIAGLADGVARAFDIAGGPDDGPIIALENSAGSGETLGTTIEEMAGILDAVAARGVPKDRVAICLDAAHLWAAGYAIADAEGVEQVVEEVDRRIGLARLAMIHFNDSRAALGSNLARHQHVGAGSIGPAGMGALIRHPRLHHVTYYLETPGMDEGYDAINTARTRDLLAGLPLADLPAAALTLRGSRSRVHPPADEDHDDAPATDSRGRPRRRA